ncbi:MAG: glycerol-3-phosphate 1-O-acyltransferase PlsY [Alphaproteobacteria bacterium]|jgi:glycerol-3-phosphate acyltransferase PlsY|nr:glycerol-3-phosphate 1-O-acyltransferase PlsY [Alphaproteobacteria bacterium]
MNIYILIFISLITAYVIGSIPFGIVINKLFNGPDLKTIGSGSTGTTNVYRASGAVAALLTLLLDSFKAVIAILVVRFLISGDAVANLGLETNLADFMISFVAGFTALIGHCFSPFLRFKGGKAVATSAGLIFYLNPKTALIALLAWIILFSWKRYVSLASISAAFAYPLILSFMDTSMITCEKIYSFILLAIFILVRHKDNVKRLINGNENKISFSKKK